MYYAFFLNYYSLCNIFLLYILERIVKFAGIEKAMHYLEQTKKIEDNGGLMIKVSFSYNFF